MSQTPMTHLPEVVIVDGIYYLQVTLDLVVPILKNGVPLRLLGDGWQFHSLHLGFAPVLLFELVHQSGRRATWFFDSVPNFLGNSVSNIPEAYRRILTHKASALLGDLLSPVLSIVPLGRGGDFHHFFKISEIARLEIGEACRDTLLPAAESMLLAKVPDVLLVRPSGAGSSLVSISRKYLHIAMDGDFQAHLTAALVDGHFSWPSPIDGSLQQSTGSFCFNHFAFAYRMEDRQSGLVYYVLASGHKGACLGFYFPCEGLVIAKDEAGSRSIGILFPKLAALMMDYICKFGETLLPYLSRSGPKRVAASMREDHLGHQLWNELSGLEDLATSLPSDQLPVIFPLGGAANAFFGPVDSIFPEFAGKLRIELGSEREIIEYANQNDFLLARFTRDVVSSGLRDRIVAHTRKSEVFRTVEARCRANRGPVVLIGLRVENRTAIDLVGFLIRLLKCVASALPGVLIVLDGQNSNEPDSGIQATTSFMSNRADRSPAAVELEVCKEVMAAVGQTDILLEIASGKPLATSIAWSELADCVISFWGAGLAKYRWIGNKPTLALSNRYNLLHRGDLLIYSLPRYMDDPTPVLFADPEAIDDDLTAPQLISVKQPSFSNFRVNEDMFFAQTRAFLKAFAAPVAP